MSYKIVREFPDDIIFQDAGLCITLYQTTHRGTAEKKKDIITYKNILDKIKTILKEKNPEEEPDRLMAPLYELNQDQDFWNHTLYGLAILANIDRCIVYKLARPVNDMFSVSKSFHLNPLLRAFQSADEYQLLGLSGKNFSLYEGNRYGLSEIEINTGIPRTIDEVLGEQHTERYLTHGSYGGTGGVSMFHGHGGKKDDVLIDLEKYFRYVDQIILENYSKNSKLPLLLVSLAENQAIFRKISNNPYLLKEGVKASYEAFGMEQLKDQAWKIFEPLYLEKTKTLVEGFINAKANGLGSDDLQNVAKAVFEKRVKTFLLEADRRLPGKFDESNGSIHSYSTMETDQGDILDDLIKALLKDKGEVIVLPKERMPSTTGVAAIYRF